jgi:hypothetical protein
MAQTGHWQPRDFCDDRDMKTRFLSIDPWQMVAWGAGITTLFFLVAIASA